jgi:diguanylate cyclase (GGDEF)-like protein
MYIARKVASPDGEFLGIIQGAMDLEYFEQLYKSVMPQGEAVISLFREDGRTLVRYPPFAPGSGAPFAGTGPFGPLKTVDAGTIAARVIRNIDGRDRLIAAHAVVHYPMVVTVSNTVSSILAEWRAQAIYLAVTAVTLELVVAAIGLIMLRQLYGQRILNAAYAARAAAEMARKGAEAELAVARERERADRILGIQNRRFAAALSNMSQALCMADSAGRLVVANARLAEMFGVPASRIAPGVTIETFLGGSPGDSSLRQSDKDAIRRSIQKLKSDNVRTAEIHELADGRVLAVNFAPVENDGWLVTLEDITEQRLAEARINHMAHHDALTGLPNRVLFHEKLTEAVARSRRGDPCAVLYLDLDHFKAVNDTLGHPVGDGLLQAVTRRLRTLVRETDIVARLGGDEFAIVQSSVDQPEDATALARRLIGALSAPYEIDGHQVMIGTSVGIAIVPTDGEDPDHILKNADLALYRAKADGRGRYRFFEPEMDALMQTRRTMEVDLRKALEAGEFELYYQPLMNLKTASVSGFEALLRWLHPERGLVQPSDFVPLAEEIGLIVPLGVWALNRACADAAGWPGKMKVAVNVSVMQFASHTLVEDVAAALVTSGLDADRLELEITETVMLDDTDAILVILHQLRALGVGIAMDDFGTGYSSLSYLRRFPFSKVKIDRSFIEGLGKGGDCDAIVTAVTELCATLGMTTLAEGVETEEQLRQLRMGNCSEAQGYLFSRPRPASEVAALCETLNQPELIETVI